MAFKASEANVDGYFQSQSKDATVDGFMTDDYYPTQIPPDDKTNGSDDKEKKKEGDEKVKKGEKPLLCVPSRPLDILVQCNNCLDIAPNLSLIVRCTTG